MASLLSPACWAELDGPAAGPHILRVHQGRGDSGEFQGIRPDGARVVVDGVAPYRMEDGKMAEIWLTIDQPLVLSQLGKGEARVA
jgi:hypothetical protein